MTERKVRLATALHRIEVHAGPVEPERPEQIIWVVDVTPAGEGLYVMGYLRKSGPEGFGQAQSIGQIPDHEWALVEEPGEARDALSGWIDDYLSESLYDVCRRALQAQASLMDFQFDIAVSAPPAAIGWAEPEPEVAPTDHSNDDHPAVEVVD